MPQLFHVWRGPEGYFKCNLVIRRIACFEIYRYMVTASSMEIDVAFVFSFSNCVLNRIQNRSITKKLCAGRSDF